MSARRIVRTSLTLLLVAGAAAYAAVPNTFTARDPLSAKTMNDNFASLDARIAKWETRYTRSARCGSTPATNGRLDGLGVAAGYPGARQACVKACGDSPTAHVCSGVEAATAASLGLPMPSGKLQSGLGLQGYGGSGPVLDCNGWTSAGGDYANYWNGPEAPSGSNNLPSGAPCNTGIPILCCD